MWSRENQGVRSTTVRGAVGLGRSGLLTLVLGACGLVAVHAFAAPRDDHRDSRSEQRPASQGPSRESRAPEVRSMPRSAPPVSRQQMPQYRPAQPQYRIPPQQAAPRPNFAPQPRPEYRQNVPAYGPQNPPRPGYGQPGYGSPVYRSPNNGSPNYGTPNYGNRNYGTPGYRSPNYGNNVPRNVQPNRATQPGQQHLGDWLNRNQGLSTQEKERALRSEPGFNRLNPDQQQRLVQRLHDLDNMRPAERERTLARVENMERLSPQQRDQVRGAADELRYMPTERQRAVRRAFQDLRNVPPGLRNSELGSPRFAGQFSPQERSVLGNLLSVEPYQPAPPPQYH